ncbi:MFS transporter [Streptomyces sp. LP11]|uniref:MFS transporter n=1 Tax=Streptomyces pyxinicus TaxID=2970331 RepID=A0ABT2B587_9ACTN|nr:MFS transporter [Streptomyces sp. LP11]MCS0603687.1 MFS transporter [Streptomyces sp. LP11]
MKREPVRTTTGSGPPEAETWLSPGVGSVGAASFCSDAGHEITTAILPTLLTSTLHATPGVLGVVEGVSDALTGLAKLAGGPLADVPERRARLATGGYLGTALATGAIGLAATVWQVGVLRALAWASRGLRSPARDALLASLAPPRAYGRAFGLERAGDNLGAVAGPLLAALLVSLLGVRGALYCAALPGLLAAVAITVAGREAHRALSAPRAGARTRVDLRRLRRTGLFRVLVPVALFELGNVAVTLLILRATQLLHQPGRSLAAATSLAVLVYAAHNAFAALVSLAGGRWIDRGGPRSAFVVGALAYTAAYALFAVPWHGWPPLLLAFVLAGTGIGLIETAESTIVARTVGDESRGSGFGLLGLVQSLGALASSAAVGLLWSRQGAAAGFGYAALLTGASATVMWGVNRARFRAAPTV